MLVPDEWDAMTLEAAGIKNLGWGVMLKVKKDLFQGNQICYVLKNFSGSLFLSFFNQSQPIRDLEFESEAGRVVDPRILPILAQMNEIQIWPFDLVVEKSDFFESLDQSKIWIQNESLPSPKYFTGREELMRGKTFLVTKMV